VTIVWQYIITEVIKFLNDSQGFMGWKENYNNKREKWRWKSPKHGRNQKVRIKSLKSRKHGTFVGEFHTCLIPEWPMNLICNVYTAFEFPDIFTTVHWRPFCDRLFPIKVTAQASAWVSAIRHWGRWDLKSGDHSAVLYWQFTCLVWQYGLTQF
jgi:hypothetical protein